MAAVRSFKPFLLGLQEKGVGMLWATHLVDIGSKNRGHAEVLGFARTVLTEQLAGLAICQVDGFDSP
ncbi:hypothetical protein MAPG_05313 [Magnaporthiopsis poae ATCC 64411]|uniref:Uncharacterized protein n=1 Tax=Magnaporthiopsis poae (strain ATCC 64411 / 73-15) TaxID=644358 RepID=A0A0C4DZ25_MAGP6|nr:hypothetical protein MAPG_05313 [Magnaporthiopsis poae ATCC 64411]